MISPSVVNVRDYGANGTPEADTLAVESALSQLMAQRRGTLYFPAGSYQITKRISIQPSPGLPFAIHGDGPGLSVVTWTCSHGGFLIETSAEGGFDGNKGAIDLGGLSLLTAHSDGGRCV